MIKQIQIGLNNLEHSTHFNQSQKTVKGHSNKPQQSYNKRCQLKQKKK